MVLADERHRRKKARHDAGLRRGDRLAHARHGHPGRALPGRGRSHRGHGRVRRGPTRLRRGLRGEALQAETRASQEARCRPAPEARRDPRAARARPWRDRHRRVVRARGEGQGLRDLDRQGLPGHDQAPPLPSRPGQPRLAQRPQAGLDRRLGDALACLQGPEDARPDGSEDRHAGWAHRRRLRSGAEPAPRQGCGAGPQERDRRGERGQPLMAAPKAPLLDGTGKKSKDVTLTAEVFGVDVKPHLIHEVVRAEGAAARAGTQAAKSRGLVSGGRSKPWRQKGTGRARAGTTRAPQWTGGGVAFPPTPRDFEVKVNRKARRSALRAVLSEHAANGTFGVLDGSGFSEPSTRRATELLSQGGKGFPLVVVAGDEEPNVTKSFRNLDRAVVVTPGELEVAALVWARSVRVTQDALDAVQGRAS